MYSIVYIFRQMAIRLLALYQGVDLSSDNARGMIQLRTKT
jgi:hypothetical protein